MKGHHVVHIHQSQKKLVHEVAIQSLGYLSIHRTGPAQKEILVAGVQYHVGGLADDPCAKTILAIGLTDKHLGASAQRIMIKTFRENPGLCQIKRVFILYIVTHKIYQKTAWFLLPAIKLERLEVEHCSFVVKMRFQDHPTAEVDGLQDIRLA